MTIQQAFGADYLILPQQEPKEEPTKTKKGAPEFVLKPEPVSIDEGQTIRLTCKVTGRKSHVNTSDTM